MSIDYSVFAIPKPKQTKKKKRKNYTDIPQWVKEKVWKRDKKRCIFCGKTVPKECACCHFIPRSAGGLRNTREYSHRLSELPYRTRQWKKHKSI